MSNNYGFRVESTEYSGQTCLVTFLDTTLNETFELGTETIPFNYFPADGTPQGKVFIYFSGTDQTFVIDITTPNPSPTPTSTVTPTPTITVTPTRTVTPTPSITPTSTVTPTVTVTPTNTVTPSITPTVTVTPTSTTTQTPTVTVTPTSTVTQTVSPTPTITETPTNTPTETPTVSPTPTITPSITPTNTVTPTITPTITPTPNLVTNGLVIQLDAHTSSSYPGTGTTVYDITGGYNHTLIGATYTVLNGIKCFDCTTGTNRVDYNATGPLLPNSGYTYITWARLISSNAGFRTVLYTKGPPKITPITIPDGTNTLGYWATGFVSSGYDLSGETSVWVQYAVVGTNSSQTFYINGSQVGSTINEGAGGTTHWGWGNNDIVAQPWGHVANMYFYNRQLSLSEITQQYNFLAPRFVEPTPTPTSTSTPTVTPTNTNTPTNTETPTNTPTNTPTFTTTPTNTPTPSVTPIPVTGYGYNLVVLPYQVPTSGNTIFPNLSVPGSNTGLTNPNTFNINGVYWSIVDNTSVNRVSYYSGMTGVSVTAYFTQNGDTAIYSGSPTAFVYDPSGGGNINYNTNARPGQLTLIQSASTNFVTGQTVYISYVVNASVTPTPTPTSTSTPTVTPTNTNTPTNTQTPTNTPTTTPTPTSAPVLTNLVLYYDPSNSSSYSGTGTTVNDLSANGLNGTMSNITFTSPYFTYNGSTSQVSRADNNLLEPGTGDFTLEVWVYYSVIAGNQRTFISKTNNGGGASDWSYGLRTNIAGDTYLEVGNGTTSVTSPSFTVSANTWYQVVGVWTNVASNSIELYINGTSQGSNSHSFASILNSTNPLYLGNYNGNEYPQQFNGRMGVVRMYSRALSSSQVQQNFNADKSKYGL
jgi:hypothetical protein